MKNIEIKTNNRLLIKDDEESSIDFVLCNDGSINISATFRGREYEDEMTIEKENIKDVANWLKNIV